MADDRKKQYEAPQLTKVSLRPEEAVLGACKISGSGGPISNNSCTASLCRNIGS
ncbi:MAG TPA: hypothetical protein VMU28_04865 [Terriglobales bacterium]|nr:hypothetical protein [Terriglobales bacterium]